MDFNKENFAKVMAAIRANPKAWAQTVWHGIQINPADEHLQQLGRTFPACTGLDKEVIIVARTAQPGECGTVHCVAGWAQILMGREQDIHAVEDDAGEWLGLNPYEPLWLFEGNRTFKDLEAVERGEINPQTGEQNG